MDTGQFVRNAWTETSIDTETVVNDVNKDKESDYCCIVINIILKPLDCIASGGTIRKCVSVAKYCINIVHSSASPDDIISSVTNDDNKIVPGNGATLYMRKNLSV